MKAGIYSPYWDTLGGGERYAASFAQAIQNKYKVEIFSTTPNLIAKIKDRFNIDLNNITQNHKAASMFNKSKNIIEKFLFTRHYNLIFFVSDGSLPFLFSQKNIVHFQVPFKNIKSKSSLIPMKLKNIQHIICNSYFTKSVIDQEFSISSQVIYPPIIPIKKAAKKENIILSVGRFDNLLISKRQDVLITAFKNLKPKNWRLVLVGGVLHGQSIVNKLKNSAKGYPIDIQTNISFDKLSTLYAKAKIYWHAAGFNLDINTHPQKAEHFGISTVEAMSAGAIPIVFNGGGLKEIITPEKNGYLWNTIDELITITKTIIKKPSISLINQAVSRSKDFSQEQFNEAIQKILN